jgi:hypothetical protein
MKQYINSEYKLSTLENLSDTEQTSILERHHNAHTLWLKLKADLETIRLQLTIDDSICNRYDYKSESMYNISKSKLLQDIHFLSNIHNTMKQKRSQSLRINKSFDNEIFNSLNNLIIKLKDINVYIGGLSTISLQESGKITFRTSIAKEFMKL